MAGRNNTVNGMNGKMNLKKSEIGHMEKMIERKYKS